MKFNLIHGRLCISVDALLDAIGLDEERGLNVVKKGLQRYRNGDSPYWEHYDDDIDARRKWVAVDAMPEVTQARVHYAYGEDLLQVYHQQQLPKEAAGLVLPDDANYFLSTASYSVHQAEHLAMACGWLRLVSPDEWWRDRWAGKIAALTAAAATIKSQRLYGFRVGSWRVLDRRAAAWLKDGHDSLVSGKIGNANAAKAAGNTRRLVERRLIDLYASPLKPSIEVVADVYNREAAGKGWPAYTTERIRQWLNEPRNVQRWIAARHGVNAARSLTEQSIRRRRPAYPDSMWSIDGTTVQLFSTDGKTLLKEWYNVTVTDAYSDCVIGWACGSSETSTLVLRAVRRAVQKSNHGPSFAQFDGALANLSSEVQELFGRLKTVGIKAQPYNGKSKYVERVQGWIEQHFMRYLPNFVGGNITARSLNSRANPDLLKRMLKDGEAPAVDQVPHQVELAISTYNNTVIKARGATPEALYAQADDRRREVPYLTQVSLFWVKRRPLARYTKDGLRLEIDGQRHFYEVQSERGVEDYAFRQAHLGDSFIVRYDPDDLDAINLYDRDDKWVATAERKHEYAATPGEWEEGEGARLLAAIDQRRRYIHDGLQEREEIRAEMADQGAEELGYELVHKDALNRIEANAVKRLLEDSGVEQAPAPRRQAAKRPLYFNEELTKRFLNDNNSNP